MKYGFSIIGDARTGKTNLLDHICRTEFADASVISEFDLLQRLVKIHAGTLIVMLAPMIHSPDGSIDEDKLKEIVDCCTGSKLKIVYVWVSRGHLHCSTIVRATKIDIGFIMVDNVDTPELSYKFVKFVRGYHMNGKERAHFPPVPKIENLRPLDVAIDSRTPAVKSTNLNESTVVLRFPRNTRTIIEFVDEKE